MQTTTLGRTGLEVTVAGLGTGGFSRAGLREHGVDHAAGIVRAAYDLGVNFFDTSAAYGTEEIVGKGLAGIPREKVILSTKFPHRTSGWQERGPQVLLGHLEQSLRLLRTDYIDSYHLHSVYADNYAQLRDAFLPVLHKAREQGKIRFLGISEEFGVDTGHSMFSLALPENLFDVIMVGYNLLNPSAAREVIPLAQKNGVGVLCMFAVRTALSNPQQLRADIATILERGQGGPGLAASEEALDFLTREGVAGSVMEAAYRFCRHTPGVDVTLTGTGSQAHLRENIASISMPPLPAEILTRLHALFGKSDCISGQSGFPGRG
jgi:aryl-alcohol dehydrogenase-like predicted oxidoreductase